MNRYAIPLEKLKKARVYDCGNGEQLTLKQMAFRSGVNEATIYARWNAGKRGEDLFAPPYSGRENRRRPVAQYRTRTCYGDSGRTFQLAFELVRDFWGKQPTFEQLQARFECSRATAYRLRRAWRDVLGEPPK